MFLEKYWRGNPLESPCSLYGKEHINLVVLLLVRAQEQVRKEEISHVRSIPPLRVDWV